MKRVILTVASVSPWVVPADFGPVNTIEALGAGGGGDTSGAFGGAGGGEYAAVDDLSLMLGTSVAFTVGMHGAGTVDGGATQFKDGSTLVANGGKSGSNGGAGGTGGTGSITKDGGAGGAISGAGGGGGGGGAGGGAGAGIAGSPARRRAGAAETVMRAPRWLALVGTAALPATMARPVGRAPNGARQALAAGLAVAATLGGAARNGGQYGGGAGSDSSADGTQIQGGDGVIVITYLPVAPAGNPGEYPLPSIPMRQGPRVQQGHPDRWRDIRGGRAGRRARAQRPAAAPPARPHAAGATRLHARHGQRPVHGGPDPALPALGLDVQRAPPLDGIRPVLHRRDGRRYHHPARRLGRCRDLHEVATYVSATTVFGFPNMTVPLDLRGVTVPVWDHGVSTVSGLTPLEGQPVSVFADGYVAASPNNPSMPVVTVSGGQITLDQPYAHIWAGLPYLGDLETLDIDTVEGESLKDSKMAVTRVGLFVESTRGVWAGDQPPAARGERSRWALGVQPAEDGRPGDHTAHASDGLYVCECAGAVESRGACLCATDRPVCLSPCWRSCRQASLCRWK